MRNIFNNKTCQQKPQNQGPDGRKLSFTIKRIEKPEEQ